VRDRKIIPIVAVGLAAVMLAAAPAVSAKKPKFKAKPALYDPDGTGAVDAAWVTHQGLPGAGKKGKSDHALYLQKDTVTATNAAALAHISKEQGITLTELGFDYQADGWCGAGAPRFNVVLEDGSLYFFGCSHGDVMLGFATDRKGDSWNRVRFTDADAVYSGVGPTSVWPGFGNAVIENLEVVFDEGTEVGPGFVYLDNLDVNGKLIGKPGNSK
jgi:hypothetical protein